MASETAGWPWDAIPQGMLSRNVRPGHPLQRSWDVRISRNFTTDEAIEIKSALLGRRANLRTMLDDCERTEVEASAPWVVDELRMRLAIVNRLCGDDGE